MLTFDQHLANLVHHIDLVRQACLLLGKKLISQSREEFGRILISNGYIHDASKFSGIEWDYLHAGNDIPSECLYLAIKQHRTTNMHHPEFWGHIANMPEIYVAEMVCDWYARSVEFETSLKGWFTKVAVSKYSIDKDLRQYKWINLYIDMLLTS